MYEDTSGIRPGEPVLNTQETLSVALGPGLLTQIYDGIQRPLQTLEEQMGFFITRGVDADAFDMEKTWTFEPVASVGDEVSGGNVIGHVQETETIVHKIMVPPNVSGTIKSIESGDFNVTQTVATLEDGTEIQMMQKWPVRSPRPYQTKYAPDTRSSPECASSTSCSRSPRAVRPASPALRVGKTVTQQSLRSTPTRRSWSTSAAVSVETR
ncbi:MAG: hypothetical protein CM15mP128_0810 [Methanobacteriota archaeon]|nr:MAG: hypothetical protein CM15mP128_0810 [Euryarchaeota archaeon]